MLAHRTVAALRSCLRAVCAHRSRTPFRLVVVSNGAPPEVQAVTGEFPWAVVVDAGANRGFAGGCNFGARHADGAHLVFLNDDAVVRDGWLDALVGFADQHDDCGAVGSLIVGPDGAVTDAGGAFARNLRPWLPDAGRPVADVVLEGPRRVTWTSGCSFLTPRHVFDELGGFDTAYYPAYLEDADYCLRLAEHGRSVWVTPSSVVDHVGSASTDRLARDLMWKRAWQFFSLRWNDVAEHRRRRPAGVELVDPPTDTQADEDVRAVDRATVIVVDDDLPVAAQGSGRARTAAAIDALRSSGTRVLVHPAQGAPGAVPRPAAGYETTSDPAAAARDAFAPVLVVSRPHNFATFDHLRRELPYVPFVYDAEARFSLRAAMHAEMATTVTERRDREREADRLELLERRAANAADVVVAISDDEADWFRAHGAREVVVVDPFPDRAYPDATPFDRRHGALALCGWLAGPGSPNADGLRWLFQEVMPLIATSPALTVTGDGVPADLTATAGPDVDFVGVVDDLDDLHRRHRVALAPLRFGAGVKLKVVDALARGVPVVATSVGAQGIGPPWRDGVVVADEPAAFAAAVHELLHDRDAWIRRHETLREAADRHRGDIVGTWRTVLARATAAAATRLPAPPAGAPRSARQEAGVVT